MRISRTQFLKRMINLFAIGAIALAPAGTALAVTSVGTNTTIAGTLTVDLTSTLTGAATLSSTLGVTGLATLSAGFISAASSSVVGGLGVDGGLLVKTGNVNASSSVFLSGVATSTPTSFLVGSAATIAGAATLSSTLGVTGLSTLTGGLVSAGNVNASSSVFLSGVATTTPTSFSLAASLLPDVNATRNLGAYGTAFGSAYVSTSLFVNQVLVPTAADPNTPSYSFANDTDTGFYKTTQGNGFILSVDGQNQLGFHASTTAPYGNGTVSLGRFYQTTTNQGPLDNIFASGTVYAASSTLFNTTGTSTIFAKSSATNAGGAIVLKAYNGTCYSIYIGDPGIGSGAMGVTSTALSACPN